MRVCPTRISLKTGLEHTWKRAAQRMVCPGPRTNHTANTVIFSFAGSRVLVGFKGTISDCRVPGGVLLAYRCFAAGRFATKSGHQKLGSTSIGHSQQQVDQRQHHPENRGYGHAWLTRCFGNCSKSHPWSQTSDYSLSWVSVNPYCDLLNALPQLLFV